jgi:predicted AlkP superfamily phosphohydrolase/phosphomutase
LLRWFIPEKTQSAVKSAVESVSGDIIDWNRTQAYWVPIYFQVCGVEVNVVEERREGIVSPGDEYEKVRDRIIAAVEMLVDPTTGKPMVELVARREHLYSGPYVKSFPDIILVLKPEYIGAGSLAGTLLAESFNAARPGEHRKDGIFASVGPAIRKQDNLTGLKLIDLPATVLYMMEQPIPDRYDGRVLTELFDPEFLDRHPIRTYIDPSVEPPLEDTGQTFTTEEEALLEDRLRGLGYIE